MRRLTLALLAVLASAATMVAVGGCGSTDCTETATCPGQGSDSSSAGDQGVEASGDAMGDDGAEGSNEVGEAGPDVSSDNEVVGDSGVDSNVSDSSTIAPTDAPPDAPKDAPAPPPIDSGGVCSGTCTPVAPSGWFGPVALFDQGGGPPAPAPAACAGTYSNDAFDGNTTPTSPAASCACSCGTAQGVCTNPTVTVYSDNQCGGSNNCGASSNTTCTTAYGPKCNTGGQSAAVTAFPQATGSGSCGAGAGVTSTPAWQWTRTGRGCSANRVFGAAGCPANQVCADAPSSAFAPKLCVWQNANLSDCSGAAGYPLMHKYYAGVVDGRGCGVGSCGCGSPTGVSCTITGATSHTMSNCSDTGTALMLSPLGKCTDVGGSQILALTMTVSSAGSCAMNGSPATTGAVTPDSATAVTVCCAQ
jgi:hypothetical protein